MKRVLFTAVAAALLLGSTTVQAAPVPDDQFQALHWRSIGPFRGGRVLAIAAAPGEPEHFYFGSVNGGVWETLNAGRTWRPIADAIPNGSIGALAVAPSDPRTIYVGTGEADMRSDIAQGIGAFKSTDGGKSWSAIGLEHSQAIGKILVDPRDPNRVLAAALGHPYGPNSERGVYRSDDGGKTWTQTLFRGPDIGAIDMAFEPGAPDVVYAALWHTRRPPWNVYPPAMGAGGGLYKSLDGGKTWTELKGLPENPGRIGVGISAANPKRVYAVVDAKDKKDGGLYRSEDGGATWAKVSDDKRIWERGWYFGGITIDPQNPDIVYICDVSTYRSADGGKTFVPVKGAPGGDDYHVLWIDPHDSKRQMLGVDQGAIITLDGGATWSSWFNQPTAQFYHVSTDNRFPYWVYGAQQDSGAAGVPSRTGSVNGVDMTNFRETAAGGESDNLAPDPDDPDTIYGGRVDKLDLKTGQTRSVDPTLAFPAHYRGTWTLPLVFSKLDPHALYFGNQRVFRTTDGGEHWDPISPDLTREKLVVPATLDKAAADDTNPVGPRRGVVYAIAPSPATAGLIWAGTDDGLVWRTADDGKSWKDVTPKGLKPWSKIGIVDASHFDAQTAYIAVDRHRLDDFSPYAYRTHDGGKSWTAIGAGLVGDGPLNTVNVIREDPKRAGLLYAGTERGAFVSFDDGATWQPLGHDLPATSVRDIEVHGDDLVIATHGRGFYVMDDIAPLRELASGAASGPRLFKPALAYRTRPFGFTGTPHPKDEPMADNPPNGAYIDYYLAAPATGGLEIDIKDASGAVIRRFHDTDAYKGADVTRLRLTPNWVVTPQAPSAAPGMHRLVWDEHYSGPEPDPSDPDWDPSDRPGVWAPPGHYTVDLKVAGQSQSQALELEPDPRVKSAPQMYADEFTLARRIEADLARAGVVLDEASKLHDRLTKAIAAADKKSKKHLIDLDRRLALITGVSDAKPDPKETPTSITDISYLAGALGKLGHAIDGADGGPSRDARTGFDAGDAALAKTLEDWKALEAEADAAVK